MKKLTVILAVFAIAVLAISQVWGGGGNNPSQSGTTLAAYKTLDICELTPAVVDENGNVTTPAVWLYSGEISIWNSGVLDTVGLNIEDWIQTKASGNQYHDFLQVPSTMITPYPWGVIPSGTIEETATVFDYSVTGPPLNPLYIRNSASITILNHSGHMGTAYGPNPKVTWGNGYPPACPTEQDCTYTIGYWGAKPGTEWPGDYDRDDEFYLSPYAWGEILPPINSGDNNSGYYQLARQYIGAVLNAANGASVPEGVENTLTLAENWFNNNSPDACLKTGPGPAPCGDQKAWAGVLDTYNKGLYENGPGHCGDE
jgi:hypothetical protein